MCIVIINRLSTADFTLWRFCTALAGTMLLVLQHNMLAVGCDQQLSDENELWRTNTVVGDLKRTATTVSCSR